MVTDLPRALGHLFSKKNKLSTCLRSEDPQAPRPRLEDPSLKEDPLEEGGNSFKNVLYRCVCVGVCLCVFTAVSFEATWKIHFMNELIFNSSYQHVCQTRETQI